MVDVMSSSTRLLVAAQAAFLAAMVAFTAAGYWQVLVLSPLGIAGPALTLVGIALSGWAIRQAGAKPKTRPCRKCPDWAVEHTPGHCAHAQLLGYELLEWDRQQKGFEQP